jgi:hypothetical protein
MKSLEVDPAERYQNCDHFFRDLEKFSEEAGIRCTPRMISAYMAEMFGEGAPAEVNYDDQYDDLVDEALDFDKFDVLDPKTNDAPDWARSLGGTAEPMAGRTKKPMTIGNLEALVAEVKEVAKAQAQEKQAAAAKRPEPAGRRAPAKKAASGRHPALAASDAPEQPGRRRPPLATPVKNPTPNTREPTAGRPAVRSGLSMTTGTVAALDPGVTSTSFGHGVMAEQNKKGGAALTWLIVIFLLGGLGYLAYTVFTMK